MARINNHPPRIKVNAKITAVTEQSDLFKKLEIKLDKLNEKISRINETQAALLAKKEDHDKTITKLERVMIKSSV